jgi:signal transduction histidine kinase
MAVTDWIKSAAQRSRGLRHTIRLRLTVIYGGLFLLSGAGVLAITYVLVRDTTGSGNVTVSRGGRGAVSVHGAILRAGSLSLSGKAGAVQVTGPKPLTLKQALSQAHLLQVQAAQQTTSELHDLLIRSGIALAIMAVVSIALGWLVAGRVLRPLRTITTAVRDISATNLHRRLDLEGPNDELKELGDTFDDLLARLDKSFQSQRQFVSNASHELRTPLARQRTVVQVALANPHATVNTLREAHESVLASGAEEERLVEALLTLTRGQAGLGQRELLDLATVTELVMLTRTGEAEQRGIHVHSTLQPTPAMGDGRLVERLVANLMDNALRHNVDDGRVDVRTHRRDGQAVVSVINTGPAVPPAELDRLLLPFQRMGSERTGQREGSGLGLSIVLAIAEAHDARLSLRSNPDGGLDIQVAFPLAGSQLAGSNGRAG